MGVLMTRIFPVCCENSIGKAPNALDLASARSVGVSADTANLWKQLYISSRCRACRLCI